MGSAVSNPTSTDYLAASCVKLGTLRGASAPHSELSVSPGNSVHDGTCVTLLSPLKALVTRCNPHGPRGLLQLFEDSGHSQRLVGEGPHPSVCKIQVMSLVHSPEKSRGVLVLTGAREANCCRTDKQGHCGFSALGAQHQVSRAWRDQGVT